MEESVSLDDDSGRRGGSLDREWCHKGLSSGFPFRECVNRCGGKQRQRQQDTEAGKHVHGVVEGHDADPS